MTKLAFYTLKVNFLPFEMLICSSFLSECLALFEEWECSVVKWQHKIPLSTKDARLPEKKWKLFLGQELNKQRKCLYFLRI